MPSIEYKKHVPNLIFNARVIYKAFQHLTPLKILRRFCSGCNDETLTHYLWGIQEDSYNTVNFVYDMTVKKKQGTHIEHEHSRESP